MSDSSLADFLGLIVITDEGLASGHGGVELVVGEALAAGCRAIQLRMKHATAREMLEAAEPLRRRTREAGALFFVNDRLDVALAADADGVHLGPDDLPVKAARAAVDRALGSSHDFLVGYSTDEPERARMAASAGADYIGCGTVYPTGSKAEAGSVIGLEGLSAVARAVDIPVVGIGGITPERAEEVSNTGATGVAVVSAVMGAADPAEVVKRLLAPFGGKPSRPS